MPVEARAFCVPGAMYTFPLKARLRKLGVQVGHVRGIEGELAAAQDLVRRPHRKKRRQHDRPDNRNPVFEVRQQLGVAARRNELIGGKPSC